MTTTKYATGLLRKYGRWVARRRPVLWVLGHTPAWVYPTIELAAIAALVVGVGWVGSWAWTTADGLGAPWWTGVLALAFPAGLVARLAKEAPTTVTRYRNWRDHTIETLQLTQSPTTVTRYRNWRDHTIETLQLTQSEPIPEPEAKP